MSEIAWLTSYTETMEEAGRSRKPVHLHFYTPT
jgi:hypothetical protein